MWIVFALLGNVLWVLSDVVNSVVVRHYEDDVFVVSWISSLFDLVLLAIVASFANVQSDWIGWLSLVGAISYLGFLAVLYVLNRLDVSVMNAAWAFMAVFISIIGFLFLGESWTALQSVGVVLILGSVLFLSFWHHHVSVVRTIGLLSLLGLLYSPFFIVQKIALTAGESVMAVFFWPLLSAKGLAFIVPWLRPRFGQKLRLQERSPSFYLLNLWAVVCSVGGFWVMTHAYQHGLVSLVSVTENAQPFMTIFFAWCLVKIAPTYAPRELLTSQSIQVKLLSFVGVFVGLYLLI